MLTFAPHHSADMDFIDELEWRGMLHDSTPGVRDLLTSGMTPGYIGFDPTAPSLTIGNYVQLMTLFGNRVVISRSSYSEVLRAVSVTLAEKTKSDSLKRVKN